ncbi:MAG: SecD/SecF family protein translocase subunit [Oscillospiraceae bacterium]|jgi:protein-export membrane protein SecD|nr:SecD/SecF family protein translocase subunit [Oscillospiraceae bacterium]
MKKLGKPWFFIVAALILALTYTSFFGVYGKNGDVEVAYIRGAKDIRWGTDIQGGVGVTFGPANNYDATDVQMDSLKSILDQRLVLNNVTDAESYVDKDNDRVILSFPWKDGLAQDPEATIGELAASAEVLFIDGLPEEVIVSVDEKGNEIITDGSGNLLTVSVRGKHVTQAATEFQDNQHVVTLSLNSEGQKIFAEATARQLGNIISIWMNYGTHTECISYPTVDSVIDGGDAVISGSFTAETAKTLADGINDGALPFSIRVVDYEIIDPVMGMNSLNAMVIAGIIAFILIAVFMIWKYKLPGAVSCLAILGQLAAAIAIVSGYFPFINSFTLTLPGIAGIILSLGMQIDANIITSERIKEELAKGKTIDGAIDSGNSESLSAIIDGNVTNIIVAIILMGVFGPTGTLWSGMLTPFLFMFGPATTGTIYSFGCTMFAGALLNFVFGVFASKAMLRSISRFRIFRKKSLYGGAE